MYYLLLIVLYPVALLPLRVLYVLSDLICFFLYHVVQYRRAVVLDNLYHAFPEKSEQEIRVICKKFYHSFCDQWIETLKLLAISDSTLTNRFTANWEVLEALRKEGKNAYVFLGHTFNWEWANVVSQMNIQQQMAGVYLPLANGAFDRLLLKLRKRGNGMMISMTNKKSGFAELAKTHYVLGLIADQNPSNLNNVLWADFMHREAPFFVGSAHMAIKAKAAIVLSQIKKLKRGVYRLEMQLLTNDASTMNAEDIVRTYVAHLEKQIKTQPENYMWTHRRWKHQRTTEQ
ncbi:MAG: lysophospholipid acyltransferase family protein [Bacteroidetes bacterium]|nr:lysophospholipid acyltransferase family protein [Bacteroidota bacterium]